MKRIIACLLTVLLILQPIHAAASSVELDSPEQVEQLTNADAVVNQLSEGTESGTDTEQPSKGTEGGTDTEQPGEGTEGGTDTEQPSEGTEGGTDTEQPSEGTEGGTDTEQPGEGTEGGTDTEQPGEGTEGGTDTEQPSEGTEGGTDTEQPSEGTEGGTDTEQPGEGTEGGTDTEQPGEGTEGGTDTEQPSEGENGELDQEIVPFSCYTVDDQGRQLHAYWSEENAAWYLFIPSTLSIADTVIYYTGSITAATSGQIDEENAVISGAFSVNGDQVALSASDETVYTVVVMQSQLPSIHVTLNDVTLDQVHADKNIKYKKNSVSVMDPSGQYNLDVEGSVEFKGRGNSTWTYFNKKAYQIKFDEKTSVLGMGKAKAWVLLANAADETLMRNMLSLDLASQLDMEFVTSYEYVDLWINGEYRGNYMLGEKVELGSSRLDLDNSYGTLFEQDTSFYYDEDYWFFNEVMGKYFTVKDTNVDDSDATQVQTVIDSFQNSVNELMHYLYSTPSADVTLSKLETMIDVDSFVKYCLINEYCGNAEAVASSFYSYMNGLDDVIHLGPVWDFDCSMGNYKTESEYYMSAHVLFNCLLASPAFNNRAVEIYNQYRSSFAKLSSNAAAIKEQIADSITMNYIRWNVWGEPNPKDSLKDYSSSYEEGYRKLTDWLYSQATSFSVQQVRIPFTRVNEKCTEMDIIFDNGEDSNPVLFAVWSDKNGQDDLKWYQAQKNSDGLWEATVDLSAHNTTGKYTIHASTVSNGVRSRVAIGYAYVDQVNPAEMSAALSADSYCIEVTMSNVGMYKDLAVHVWCETDGKNDFKEYAVEKQDGSTQTSIIELRNHDEVGVYQVQLHGKIDDTWTLIGETSVTVTDKTWPIVAVDVIAEQKEMVVSVDNAKEYSGLELQVWCEADGQEDIATYEGTKDADGVWSATIDLDAHGENGTYQILIIGVKNDEKKQIAVVEADVDGIVFLKEAIVVYRLYNPYTQEHLLTASAEEKDHLLEAGWQLDGVAWRASETGLPVCRLYNPYDDWHTYSMSQEEIDAMVSLGWTVDGIVFNSTEAVNKISVYRLFNPYEQKNYHLLTASEDECAMLLNLGWVLDGVALHAVME